MRGSIVRRGRASWRLKLDVGADPVTGARKIHYQTVKGKRQSAEKELTKLLTAAEAGMLVAPSKITVGEAIRTWLDNTVDLSPKTRQRYRELLKWQIGRHIGLVELQKLRPADVASWHEKLLCEGGAKGGPLYASTVASAHRVLARYLEIATKREIIARNVASVVSPPRVPAPEIEILSADEMSHLLDKLEGHKLHAVVAIALGSGMRRGELCALRWTDLDLDAGIVRVERSLEQTREGLRFKTPKTKRGRRMITLPASVIDILRVHRRQQLEHRLVLGLGKPASDALVFSTIDGLPLAPDTLSRDWRRAVKKLGLPPITFHALRHSHASALIASGVDVLAVSRRLGHEKPTVTLSTYGHLFGNNDEAAAAAIEAALKGR